MSKKLLIQLTFILLVVGKPFCQTANDSLLVILEGSENEKRIEILHALILSNWLNYPDQAMKYGREALSISNELGDSLNISKSLRLIAGVYYYRADYENSLDYNFQALDIAFQLNDSALINNGYNNIGLLYYDLGNYQTALEYLLRSRAIKHSIGEVYGLGTTLNNIGLIYDRANDFDQARENFFKALRVAIETNNRDVQVYSWNNIGITYRKQGQFTLAASYFDSARHLASEIGNINWGAVSLRNIGEILRYQGSYDSAKYYYQESLAACKSIGERKGVAESYLFLAKLALDQGDISGATHFLDKSHQIAGELKIRYQLLENLRLYASIHLVDRDDQKVILNQLKYLDLRDSLFEDAVGRNLSMVPIKLKEENDRIQLSRQQAELKNQGFINTLYAIILIIAIPVFSILIILLRKNKIAYAELRENNEELKRTQNLLVTSEKMASLGVLAAGVGHEINNPLNYIKNGVNVLSATMEKKYKGAMDEMKEYFEVINQGVDRASRIVKSLSHFSRGGVNTDEYCKIEDILENCLLILGNKLKKTTITRQYTKTPAVVHGNEGKLHQAFMNILSNAEQAMEEKGEITISTTVVSGKMIITIKDDGIGIPEENLLKIGDPFFTTKPPGQGTGLGLFITYAIIEEHKGEISVISEPAIGTEFTITLPLYRKN